MKRCIFCGKSEDEFTKNNCWTEEHIIPEALGNKKLKLYNVCKNCNSGLGTYVDNYFVNHMLLNITRQNLGLKGQSGEIPNAFKEGKDKDGHRIRVDENYQPVTVPYIEQSGNNVTIVASTKEEVKKIIQKKLSRMKMPPNVIREELNKVDQAKSHFSKPEIQYDFRVELNRFFLEALKIGFEYAVYKLGDDYLQDSRAMEIQKCLKDAIVGKMKNECSNISGVYFIPEEVSKILKKTINLNFHMLMIHPDAENQLIVQVILFMNPALSFSVLISQDTSKFDGLPFAEIVEIKTHKNM